YPGSDPDTFPMGHAVQLAGGTWRPGSTQLINWFGSTGYLGGCHLGTGLEPPVVIRGVLGACGDGGTASSYVELAVTDPPPELSGLELQVDDGRGPMRVPLFPEARAFEVWPPGRSLLIASDSFATATGITPDRRLPRTLGVGTATVQVLRKDPALRDR